MKLLLEVWVASFSDVQSQGGMPGTWKDSVKVYEKGTVHGPHSVWGHKWLVGYKPHGTVYISIGVDGFMLNMIGFNIGEKVYVFRGEPVPEDIKAFIREVVGENYPTVDVEITPWD